MKKIVKTRDTQPRYFLERLYNLLNVVNISIQKSRYPEIIRWTSDGKGIVILNKVGLIKEILAHEFQQSSYKSFTKQMNLYNFKTSKDECGFSVFYNDNFKNGYQDIMQMMTTKKQIQKQKTIPVDFKCEHENLKSKLSELFRFQQNILKAIRCQLLFHRHLQKQVEDLRIKIQERKERGLFRRRTIYKFFNTFFGNMKSSIICNVFHITAAHKFLILNHDLLCQCENEDEECQDFSISRSICHTPYLTPYQWTFRQQESIRIIQEIFQEQGNTSKTFTQLTQFQQDKYIENIWEE